MKPNSKKTIFYFLLFFSLLTIFLVGYLSTPSYKSIKSSVIGSDIFILDRDEQIIQRVRTDYQKRQLSWLPLDSYSKNLIQVILKIEDKRFYNHFGIDLFAGIRALKSFLQKKRIEGASTITMQLSDLIDKSVLIEHKQITKGVLSRKFLQIFRSLFIELKWSKSEILESYLNLIHLKGEAQGVHAFTMLYFNKSPHSLTQEEALILASLIRKPNSDEKKLYSRTCSNALRLNPEFQCEKLWIALNSIYKNKTNHDDSLNEAPHLAAKLIKKNKNQQFIKSYVYRSYQKEVQSILKKNIAALQKNNVSDISAIVLDNKTGEVLAYIGTVSKYSKSKSVDGVDAPRAAGSTLKPFLYGKALEKKLATPASIISDEPTVLSWEGGLYRPTNYDHKFHGNVTLREALASSLNVPAIKIVKILGLQETYETIKSLHFSSLKNPDFYGASIALGAVDVKLHELTNAYRAIANDGEYKPLRWAKDQTNAFTTSKITSKEVAYLIKSILSDSNARRIGFGWDSALETKFWTAVKTGTSKGLRDNWCIGFSDKYTVGVWTGNFSSEGMKGVSGVSGAAPSWYEIMNYLHSNERSLEPKMPEGVVAKKIKFKWKIGEITEYFLKGTEPKDSLISLPERYDISITFPAKNSVLAINPHLKEQSESIFLRYKGKAPENSLVYFNDINLGVLENPFKITKIKRGKFNIKIIDSENKILDAVDFEIK